VLKGTRFLSEEHVKPKHGGDTQQSYRTWPAELPWFDLQIDALNSFFFTYIRRALLKVGLRLERRYSQR
jgi:hypothetical protein